MLQRGSPKYCMDTGIGLFGNPPRRQEKPSPPVFKASPRPRYPDDDPDLLSPSMSAVNVNSEDIVQIDAMSPGYVTRIARAAEKLKVGEFPSIHLMSSSSASSLDVSPRSLYVRRPVKVQIAPPANSMLNLIDKTTINEEPVVEALDESMKSVIQVLKGISRKRVYIPLDSDSNPSQKRSRITEHNLALSQLENSVQIHQQSDTVMNGKRGREECSLLNGGGASETKRARTLSIGNAGIGVRSPVGGSSLTRNNEILSSLSSSIGIMPPHLLNNKHKSRRSGSHTPVQSERHSRRKRKNSKAYLIVDGEEDDSIEHLAEERSKRTELRNKEDNEPKTPVESPLSSKETSMKLTFIEERRGQKIIPVVPEKVLEKEDSEEEEPPPPPRKTEIIEKVVTRPMVNALLKSAITKFVSTGDASVIPIAKPAPPTLPVVTLAPAVSSPVVTPQPIGLSGGNIPLSPVVVSSPSSTTTVVQPSETTISKPETLKSTLMFGLSPPAATTTDLSKTKPDVPIVQFGVPNISREDKPLEKPAEKVISTTTSSMPTFSVGSFSTSKLGESKDVAPVVSGFKFTAAQETKNLEGAAPLQLNDNSKPVFSFGTNDKLPENKPQFSFGSSKPPTTSGSSETPQNTFGFQPGGSPKVPSFQFGTASTTLATTPAASTATTVTDVVQPTSKTTLSGGFSFQAVVTSVPAQTTATTSAPLFGSFTSSSGKFGNQVSKPSIFSSAASNTIATSNSTPTTTVTQNQQPTSVFFGTLAKTESPAVNSAPNGGIFSGQKPFGSLSPFSLSKPTTTTVTAATTTPTTGVIFGTSTGTPSFGGSDKSGNFTVEPGKTSATASIFGTSTLGFGQKKETTPATTATVATTTSSGIFSTSFGAGGLFGSTVTTSVSSSKPSTGGFSYNLTPNSGPIGAFGDSAAKSTFSFQTPASTKPAEQKPQATAPIFSFGSSQNNSTFGSSTPAFGSFGAKSTATPAFSGGGSSGGGTQPTFGSVGFGASGSSGDPPAFGSTGSQQKTPTFSSTALTPAFSASTQSPAFGSTTQQSTPAFGSTAQQPAPAFSSTTQQPTPTFGAVVQQSAAPTFGSASTPTFGTAVRESKPGFSFTTGPTATPTAPAPAFGASASTPAFGGLQTANKPFAFGTPAATTVTQPAQLQPQSGGMFSFRQSGGPSLSTPQLGSAFQFNATPQAPQATGFNFNAPTTTFQLGGGAPMFSIGSGSTAPRNRAMRTRRR